MHWNINDIYKWYRALAGTLLAGYLYTYVHTYKYVFIFICMHIYVIVM
jgi:hypothetical protein